MDKKLPLIELKIDEDTGSLVYGFGLTETPAIESLALMFSGNNPIQFSSNEERMEMIGIAMKAEVPIYRNSPTLGEYNCFFSKETIREIAQVFAKNGFNNNLNVEHTDEDAEAYIFQSYIVDIEKGINAPTAITDAKDGDWIIGIKCDSRSKWEKFKASKNGFGFSAEGIFQMWEAKYSMDLEPSDEEISELLNQFSEALLKVSQ